MKAAVYHGGGAPVVIEDIRVKDPGQGEEVMPGSGSLSNAFGCLMLVGGGTCLKRLGNPLLAVVGHDTASTRTRPVYMPPVP